MPLAVRRVVKGEAAHAVGSAADYLAAGGRRPSAGGCCYTATATPSRTGAVGISLDELAIGFRAGHGQAFPQPADRINVAKLANGGGSRRR
jgi:hypothetical protein